MTKSTFWRRSERYINGFLKQCKLTKPHSVLLGVFLPVCFSLPTRALPAGLGKACAQSGRKQAAVITFLPRESCAIFIVSIQDPVAAHSYLHLNLIKSEYSL